MNIIEPIQKRLPEGYLIEKLTLIPDTLMLPKVNWKYTFTIRTPKRCIIKIAIVFSQEFLSDTRVNSTEYLIRYINRRINYES